MARGVKTGTVRGSYAKKMIRVRYPAAYLAKAIDWKIRLQGKAGHEFASSVDEVTREMLFEVRASRAYDVARGLRDMRVGGNRISAQVFELV